jgi:hypothetical protein
MTPAIHFITGVNHIRDLFVASVNDSDDKLVLCAVYAGIQCC